MGNFVDDSRVLPTMGDCGEVGTCNIFEVHGKNTHAHGGIVIQMKSQGPFAYEPAASRMCAEVSEDAVIAQ